MIPGISYVSRAYLASLSLLVGCTLLPTKEDLVDPDGDGSPYGEDCDDGDSTVYPGADDVCGDGFVNGCDVTKAAAMAYCGLSGTLSLSGADLKFVGDTAGGRAGSAVSGAGDVDGDGRADLLVGALDDAGSEETGVAYLLLSAGTLGSGSSTLVLSESGLNLIGEATDDNAGTAVATAGDVDGDGRADLLVGASGESSGGSGAGAAYLLLSDGVLGDTSGALGLSGADLKLTGEVRGDQAGISVSGVGDVGGDGRADFLIGALGEGSAGSGAGAAYLLMSDGALASHSSALDLSEADLKLTGEAPGDRAGISASGAGDVDGDGHADLLVGARDHESGGAAYLLLAGGALDTASATLSLSAADLKLTGESDGDRAGGSVSGVGDVDGDGRGDLVVGAFYEGTGGADAGAAYLLLSAGALEGASSTLHLASANLKLTGEAEGDFAGNSVSGAGDVDGDGRSDLLIGALYDATGGAEAGAAYLLLSDGALNASGVLSLAVSDLKLTGEDIHDFAGYSVSGAGDVNGDGFDDLLIGACREDTGGGDVGAAYLIYGGGY